MKFNINIMDQFNHEQLQQVIRKYDAHLKRMQDIQRDREEEIEELHAELDRLQNQHEQDDVEMYKEEIIKLKSYLNQLSQENEELRRAQAEQDRLHVQEAMRAGGTEEKENEKPEERQPESPGSTPTRQAS